MKKILVTGASSGIGYSTTKLLLERGYEVVAMSRTLGKLEALMSAYSAELNHYKIDLIDFSSYEAVLKQISNIDGFVHSAGIVLNNPIKYFNLKKYQSVIDLNQTAPLLITSLLVKHKIISHFSSIVFISSINGPRVGIKGCAAYAASKSALHGITKVLSLELSSLNIRVNTVSPGMVQTEMVDALYQLSESDKIIDMKKYPLGNRYAQPTEVSDAIEFLLSERSHFITGQDLIIDGGYCAN